MSIPGAGAGAEKAPKGRTLAFIGGIRSGKSALAQGRFSGEVARLGLRSSAYLGTLLTGAQDRDGELARRIAVHRAARPTGWATVDVAGDLPAAAKRCLEAGHDAWLLDGLGAWAALRLERAQEAMAEWEAFAALARRVPLVVVVLDEVGQGGLPGHPAARAFVDLNGALNQAVCAGAAELWSAQAGLAWRLK